ncbi:hypothetical protein ACFQ60_37715 [Streptomyces zhihengii]
MRDAAGGDVLGAARAAAVAHGLFPEEADREAFARLAAAHAHHLSVLADYRPAPATSPPCCSWRGSGRGPARAGGRVACGVSADRGRVPGR